MTSSMTSPIDALYAVSYWVHIGHEPLNRLVSDIFNIKFADEQTDTETHRQTNTLTDNKGRLSLQRASQQNYESVAATEQARQSC